MFRVFWIPPKNPYLDQGTQKITCQIFLPPKIPESKISSPKKSFPYPRHLKSGDPPPPPQPKDQLLGFDRERFGVLNLKSLMGGGRLRKVVARGSSTV